MQKLWSRAALRECTCSCPSYLSPTVLISRHATTAAARRRLRYGKVSTVLYYSILATAATYLWYRGNKAQEAPTIEDVYNALIIGLFNFNETTITRSETGNMFQECCKPQPNSMLLCSRMLLESETGILVEQPGSSSIIVL